MAERKTKSGCLPYGYRRGGVVRPRRGVIVYHLGLGSNQGDRGGHIEKAVEFLQGCGRVLKRSAVYETTPLGMPGSGLFLNMVLALESQLAPPELLAKCREHEAAQERDLENSHYRDRPIDIDILLAGDLVIATPELTVPHPRLHERGFVLVPLFEIAPKLVHPVEKVTVARLLSRLKGGETIRRL
ncbi:MAG TPA: 2-amino-4-hydroxy-6-hydroxymethyldihydropteridine diphosphokinase [Patescibacteria group bacterium]|nr:2-amino-4-hydroxy-6-hydroxymethyldihydropteridine diphosphokinase [Patescibacteria group bacterium]